MISNTYKKYNQFANPFSLIWKWGFLLSLVIWMALLIKPMLDFANGQEMIENENIAFRHQLDQRLPAQFSQLPDLEKETIENLLAMPKDKLVADESIKNYLTKKYIHIQVHAPDGKLIYSSGDTFFPVNVNHALGTSLKTGEELQESFFPIERDGQLVGYYFAIYDLTPEQEALNANRSRYIYFVGISLLLALILGYAIAFWLLRPIQHVQMLLQGITGENISETRLAISNNNDEIADISLGINQLLDRMTAYIDQQTSFVEDVSHELRTPVAIVEGHLQLLNRWGKNDPELLDESLQASLNEMQRMKILVQEMLDLTRAGQVDVQYVNEETVVNDVIHSVFQNFTMLYEDFTFYLEDDLKEEYLVQMYRNHLEQVLVILMDNAVKYSLERKEIHLSVAADTAGYIEIAIQDFGEGMSREDQKRIFDRFYRVDKARSRDKGGNGLGLSIAKELIEGYKGRISVESALGFGTIFHIRLPILSETSKDQPQNPQK